MIARILAVFAIAMVLFLAGGVLLPRDVQVERSIEIQRPVPMVFTVLNRIETLPLWSPWVDRDPGVEIRFSGPRSGPGAKISWSGDPRQVGTGHAEIVDASIDSFVHARILIQGQAEAEAVFTVQRIAGGARVTWSLGSDLAAGRGPFGALVSRYFGLVFERWIGGDLERGLRNLQAYAQSMPAADFSGIEVEMLDVEALSVLYVARVGNGQEDSAVGLAEAYREITAFMAANDLEMTAQPMALVRGLGGGRLRHDAAIPVQHRDLPTEGNVRWGWTPAGPAARTVHHGAYQGLARTHAKLTSWLAAHGYRAGNVSWEHYVSDPAVTAVDERLTHIYIGLAE